MIGKLKKILMGDQAYSETAEDSEQREQLALASLLVEMARADFDESKQEHLAIIDLLSRHFELQPQEAMQLLERARASSDRAVCLFDFTRALHECLDSSQRQNVIRLLWQVAMSDNKLERYEDHLVRKVADLLYVPDSDVMRIRNEVIESNLGSKT
ncbi:MAG: TerB family tellurite resistance protein [Pseudomonadota bacterium]|nr:TerB family tellurite resistance protein [Pseudomonadota bacterium]